MIEKENEYRAALYCHLSYDDAYLVESGSIQTQKALLTQYCRKIIFLSMTPMLMTGSAVQILNDLISNEC